MIHDETQGTLEKVRTWATEQKLVDQLEEQLTYLSGYACRLDDGTLDPGRTVCCLYPDFAPQSFTFNMFRALPPEFEAPAPDNPELRRGKYRNINGRWYVLWFNGGLIFHDDRGFSGGALTYSVSLQEGKGARWEVHT